VGNKCALVVRCGGCWKVQNENGHEPGPATSERSVLAEKRQCAQARANHAVGTGAGVVGGVGKAGVGGAE